MLSNRRVETRRDFEHRDSHGNFRRKRSRNAVQNEASGRHWLHPRYPKDNIAAGRATSNTAKRKFLSKYKPARRRHHQPKIRYESHPSSRPLSPAESTVYQVKIVSPQPPHRETKQSRAQRYKDIGVFSNTYSNTSTEDNLDGRDDYEEEDVEDSSFSYYSDEFDEEEEYPRGHPAQPCVIPKQQRVRIMETREATKRLHQKPTKRVTPQPRRKVKASSPPRTNTAALPTPQQKRSWHISQPANHDIDDAVSPLCCAISSCPVLGGKRPSLMSLTRHRIPGMTHGEEQTLWKEAIRHDLQQYSRGGASQIDDDPTIDTIEVVPVDKSFNSQGGFTYTEREGTGMLFAPQSLPQTPEALPWWKRDGWTNLTEGDTVANATHTTAAYNKNGCGDFFSFRQPTKTLLQQARDDIASPRRHNTGKPQENGKSRNIPSVARREINRGEQLRMGYYNGRGATGGAGRLKQNADPGRRSSIGRSMVYDSMSNSDLDESLDERVDRIDQLREAEQRRACSDLQTFRAKDNDYSTESEVSLSLDVPHLNHDYRASHFELQAQRYGKPYVVEAVHGGNATKESSQSSNDQSLLPSGSDLSAIVKQKYEDQPRISLCRHRVQPLSTRRSPEVIELHDIPTKDSTEQHLGNVPTSLLCHGGMTKNWYTRTETDYGENQRFDKEVSVVREQARKSHSPRMATEPKHVIFVDEPNDGVFDRRADANGVFKSDPVSTRRRSATKASSLNKADLVYVPKTHHWEGLSARKPEKGYFDGPSLLTGEPQGRNNLTTCLSPRGLMTPNNKDPEFERRAASPIRLYGDPPEMRREDGSPFDNQRGDGSHLDACNKGDLSKDGEVGNLGDDLKALLKGLSPRRTERGDGLIIFRPTINVIRPSGKAELVLEDERKGRFLDNEPEGSISTEADRQPKGHLRRDASPSNIVSARTDCCPLESMDLPRNRANKAPNVRTEFVDGPEHKPASAIERDHWASSTKPWYYSNQNTASDHPRSERLDMRRSRPQTELKSSGQRVADIIDLSQQVLNDSRSQDDNSADHYLSPGVVNTEIRLHACEQHTSPASPSHRQPHHTSASNMEASLTDLSFIETASKPMIPLGLSIHDYSSSSRPLLIKSPDTKEEAYVQESGRNNKNPFGRMHVDTNISWKTVQNLYRLTPSGKSDESLEKVFSGRSVDEDDHRSGPDDNVGQDEFVSSLEQQYALGNASASLYIADSISSGDVSTSFDLESILTETRPNESGPDKAWDTTKDHGKSQHRLPASNNEQQARLSGQKIYAELLRRGKLDLDRSSSRKGKVCLEPIHEDPESRVEETEHAMDKALDQRNAAVSRLKRLRKLQSKLHAHSDEGTSGKSQGHATRETAGTVPAPRHAKLKAKLDGASKLKAKLDGARKKQPQKTDAPVVGSSTIEDSQNNIRKKVTKQTTTESGQRDNSLIKIYVQDQAKTPNASNSAKTPTSPARAVSPSPKVASAPSTSSRMPKVKRISSMPKQAKPSRAEAQCTSNKIPKDKLISSMPRQAKVRSAAAAKPGSLLWAATSKTKRY